MGMLDRELLFSDGQAVTAIGDTPSTNTYDAGGANGQGDIGQTGENLWFVVRAKTAATSGGAATLQVVLQGSLDSVAWTDFLSGAAVPVANITAGAELFRTQPPAAANPGMPRYTRIAYRVATAALTGGTFDAYIANAIQRNIARASGFSVQ